MSKQNLGNRIIWNQINEYTPTVGKTERGLSSPTNPNELLTVSLINELKKETCLKNSFFYLL